MTGSSPRVSRACQAVGALVAAAYIAIYVGVAVARIAYPYELEWFEGTSVDLVRRILAGQAIYVEPSIDFIPHLYAPLYFYAGAALSNVLGFGFFALRALSFASSLGCLALIFALARRESGSSFCGLLAAGFFAACFRLSGAWYDLARVDSLSLLFLLGSIVVIRLRPTLLGGLAAGVLGVLAFFTKQNALPILGALALYGLHAVRGRAAKVALPITVGAGVLAVTMLLDHATAGWFSYYVFEIPGQGSLPHHILWLMMFWVHDVPNVAIAIGAALFSVYTRLRERRTEDLWFFVPMLAMTVFSAWSARIHAGGYDNALIVMDAWLAVAAAVAVCEIMPRGGRAAAVAAALAILQFAVLAYDPRAQVPTDEDVVAGDRIVEQLRRLPGDVLVAHHPYLGVLAGKPAHGHLDLVNTIPRGTEARQRLDREIEEATHGKRFEAIVLDRRKDRNYRRRLTPDLDQFYEYRGSLLPDDAFWSYTGLITRPQDLYVRRP